MHFIKEGDAEDDIEKDITKEEKEKEKVEDEEAKKEEAKKEEAKKEKPNIMIEDNGQQGMDRINSLGPEIVRIESVSDQDQTYISQCENVETQETEVTVRIMTLYTKQNFQNSQRDSED